MKAESYISFRPSPEDIDSFKENDGEKWRDHIEDMIVGSTKEVRKIVKEMLNVIANLPLELQPLPYYTEHFKTHPRNVLRLSFEIMSIRPEIFDEKDVLIITLASLIHDLGQLPPGEMKKEEEPKKLEEYFVEKKDKIGILENKELKKIFGDKNEKIENYLNDSKFILGKIILNIAKYHPKSMPFDENYIENAKSLLRACEIEDKFKWEIEKKLDEIREKIEKEKEVKVSLEKILENLLELKYKELIGEREITTEEIKERIKKEVRHYLRLAAILKLADGCDIQIYRDTNKYSYMYKIDYIHKKFKDKEEREKSIRAYMRDICIKKVVIKRVCINEKTKTVEEVKEKGDYYIIMVVNLGKEDPTNSESDDIYGRIYEDLSKKEETKDIIKELERKYIEELLEDAFVDACIEFLLARTYLSSEDDSDINIKGIIIVKEKKTDDKCSESKKDKYSERKYSIIDGFHLKIK